MENQDECERLRRQLECSKKWSRQLAENLANAHARIVSQETMIARMKNLLIEVIESDAGFVEPGGFDDLHMVRRKARTLLAEMG